jgi:hypothetical protein
MMNTRALVIGLMVAAAIHIWLLWPVRRSPASEPTQPGLPPVQPVAVRQLDEAAEKVPDSSKAAESAKPASSAEEIAASDPKPPQKDEPAKPEPATTEVATAQEQVVPAAAAAPEVTAAVTPPPAPKREPEPVAQPSEFLAKAAPPPPVPSSGLAQVAAPLAAVEAVIESAPLDEPALRAETATAAALASTPAEVAPLMPVPAQVAVAAPREPGPPPLPPPPALPRPATMLPQDLPPAPTLSRTAVAVEPPALSPTTRTAPTAKPTLRLRSRAMRSWDRDDMLESLPKPDPAFLSATDPRMDKPASTGRRYEAPRYPDALVQLSDAAVPTAATTASDRSNQPAPSSSTALAAGTAIAPPRDPAPYQPVAFASSKDRTGGRGAQAADRGYLKSLGPVPQDPVARIAWGDPAAAMRTMDLGRMALVIVNDDLKVVASIDGSTGAWVRGGLPQHMTTYSNRVRVVDHVSAFAAFVRFCEPEEHLAVLVPVGLERRIDGAMDKAARAQGLSRSQVAACYGRLEPQHGALEFVIDRVERRNTP